MPSKKGIECSDSSREQPNSLKIHHFFIPSTTLSFSPVFTTFCYNLKKKDITISKSQISFKYLTWISVSPIPLHFLDICYPSLLIQSNDIIEWEKISIRVSPHTIYHFKLHPSSHSLTQKKYCRWKGPTLLKSFPNPNLIPTSPYARPPTPLLCPYFL